MQQTVNIPQQYRHEQTSAVIAAQAHLEMLGSALSSAHRFEAAVADLLAATLGLTQEVGRLLVTEMGLDMAVAVVGRVWQEDNGPGHVDRGVLGASLSSLAAGLDAHRRVVRQPLPRSGDPSRLGGDVAGLVDDLAIEIRVLADASNGAGSATRS